MIEPDFLSVAELASNWKATPRQILEHGAHLRLPILFSFSGLAFEHADRWLMSHGATDEQRELEQKMALIEKWVSEIKRNAAGLTDKYSSMDRQQVVELRSKITEYVERTERLKDLLELRERDRRNCEYFGYMRLPPRAIQEVIDHGEIPFPHLAFHPGSRLKLAEADGRPYVDGAIMKLEPGTGGKWKDRLTIDDLLIPMPAIKAIEQSRKSNIPRSEIPKRPSVSATQDQAILDELRALGYDPANLPPYTPTGGARSEVRLSLLSKRKDIFTDSSFKHSWDRLKGTGKVVWIKGDK